MPTSIPTRPVAQLEPLLTTEEAAQALGLSAKTLNNDRCTRAIGIPFAKFGRSVRYRPGDLRSFIEASTKHAVTVVSEAA